MEAKEKEKEKDKDKVELVRFQSFSELVEATGVEFFILYHAREALSEIGLIEWTGKTEDDPAGMSKPVMADPHWIKAYFSRIKLSREQYPWGINDMVRECNVTRQAIHVKIAALKERGLAIRVGHRWRFKPGAESIVARKKKEYTLNYKLHIGKDIDRLLARGFTIAQIVEVLEAYQD
jgi:biotin operon repressor